MHQPDFSGEVAAVSLALNCSSKASHTSDHFPRGPLFFTRPDDSSLIEYVSHEVDFQLGPNDSTRTCGTV